MTIQYTKDWLAKWAAYRPDAPAIMEYSSKQIFTYAQCNLKAEKWRHWLLDTKGLQQGDRLAILCENCADMVFLFGAAQKTGIILVPINWRLSPSEVIFMIKDCQASGLLAHQKFLDKLNAHQESKSLNTQLKFARAIEDLSMEVENFHLNDHLLSPIIVEEEDPVFILYTSGTTGFPKGAIYTHKMLLWNSINTALRLDITSQDRTLNVMPLFHTGGWNVLLTPFLHRGAFTILMQGFEPQEVLACLSQEEVTIFMGVPTMLNMMKDQATFDSVLMDKLRYMIVGGEAMPIPLIETYHKKGIPIRQGYGMTEAGPNLTSLNHHDAIRKIGSIGKPNFYIETKIVDEAGKECGDNIAGELLIRGPIVTPGYWDNEEATQRSIKDGWLYTGDMARRDEEGFIYIVDRIKNMFISGGENVYPAEVERVLMTHPAIGECAVVPIPDLKWGECGRAFIKLDQTKEISATELKSFCQDKLAKFKIPKEFVILDELPKIGSGKIDRKSLKESI
ncbi:MAG: o-succinylbenzoate--CoA ligase [Bacteroidota bacterium]